MTHKITKAHYPDFEKHIGETVEPFGRSYKTKDGYYIPKTVVEVTDEEPFITYESEQTTKETEDSFWAVDSHNFLVEDPQKKYSEIPNGIYTVIDQAITYGQICVIGGKVEIVDGVVYDEWGEADCNTILKLTPHPRKYYKVLSPSNLAGSYIAEGEEMDSSKVTYDEMELEEVTQHEYEAEGWRLYQLTNKQEQLDFGREVISKNGVSAITTKGKEIKISHKNSMPTSITYRDNFEWEGDPIETGKLIKEIEETIFNPNTSNWLLLKTYKALEL